MEPLESAITVGFDLPEGWSREQANEFVKNALQFGILINGEQPFRSAFVLGSRSVSYSDRAAGKGTLRIAVRDLNPAQFAEYQTLTLTPVVFWTRPTPEEELTAEQRANGGAAAGYGELMFDWFTDNAMTVQLR